MPRQRFSFHFPVAAKSHCYSAVGGCRALPVDETGQRNGCSAAACEALYFPRPCLLTGARDVHGTIITIPGNAVLGSISIYMLHLLSLTSALYLD
jgi:hypothetical protein